MAEEGLASAGEDGGHGFGDRRLLLVADRVDTCVDLHEACGPDPSRDSAWWNAEAEQLLAGDVPELPIRDARYLGRYVSFFSQGPL